MTLAEIRDSAMQLSRQERAELLDWLSDNFEMELSPQIQKQWATESEKRIDAVERGELPTVDGPEALKTLRRSLGV